MSKPTRLAPSPADAREIIRLNLAYTQARVLHSAVELGLFDFLADGPRTAGEVTDRLALNPRLVGDWLDALAGLGLLTRCDGGYANTEGVERFLVQGRPHYLGGSVLQHGRVHFELWRRFSDALRDGEAKSDPLTGAGAVQEERPDLDRARRFLSHMDALNGFVAEQLGRVVDWGCWRSFVDVGGARGNVAARLVLAHPHLRGVVFDVPGVEPLFTQHVAALGVAGPVRFQGGDFFRDPLPAADVAIVGHVLHDWPVGQRRQLIAQTYRTLHPGGALLVYDAMLDPQGGADAYLQSLVCGLIRDGGSEYRVEDACNWAREAGFEVEQVLELDTVTRDRLLVARKSA
jgi:N,N-dimethyltransferase/O-methyltransferase